MSKINRRTTIGLDPEFKIRIEKLNVKLINAQGTAKMGLREVTRRMSKAFTMDAMEKELIKDAEIKRRLGLK